MNRIRSLIQTYARDQVYANDKHGRYLTMLLDTVVSAATGHQRGERRGRGDGKQYFEDRNKKLDLQRNQQQASSGALRNVRVYIGGYLNGTTDIEMKRLITLAGGTTL